MKVNFLKRSITSLLRNPGKTIILFLLIFILGTALIGAFAATRAVVSTSENIRRDMRPILTISYDIEATIAEILETGEISTIVESIDIDTVRQVGALEYVADYRYYLATHIVSFELINYLPGIPTDARTRFEGVPDTFVLLGTSNSAISHIEEGAIEFVSGSTFTEDELNVVDNNTSIPVLISRPLAEYNNLSVGQTFTVDAVFVKDLTISLPSAMYAEDNIFRESYQLEIIGTFDIPNRQTEVDVYDAYNIEQLHRQQEIFNRMYVPVQLFELIDDFSQRARLQLGLEPRPSSYWVNSIFLLRDPLYIEAFRAEVEPLLPEGLILEDLSNRFNTIESVMTSVEELASDILWLCILATVLILALLITLFLRDRRHEIGIYLSLGEKRGRIASQILTEVVLVTLFGITLAVFSGNILSRVVSTNMIRNELVAIAEREADQVFGRTGGITHTTPGHAHGFKYANPLDAGLSQLGLTATMPVDEVIDSFDTSLDATTIGLFYIVGFGVVSLATVVPILYVIKLSPRRVLMG